MRSVGRNEKKLIEIAEHELGARYQIIPVEVMPRKIKFATKFSNLIGFVQLEMPQNPERLSSLKMLASTSDVPVSLCRRCLGDQRHIVIQLNITRPFWHSRRALVIRTRATNNH